VIERAEVVVGRRAHQGFELLAVEEADVRVSRRCRRPVGHGHRIRDDPAAPEREGEHTVRELEVVRHRLHREAGAPLRRDVVADVARLDGTERSRREEGPEVPPKHDPVVLHRRALALHDLLEVPEVVRGRDLERQLPVR
jgi:hypothetical protein